MQNLFFSLEMERCRSQNQELRERLSKYEKVDFPAVWEDHGAKKIGDAQRCTLNGSAFCWLKTFMGTTFARDNEQMGTDQSVWYLVELDRVRVLSNRESSYLAIFDLSAGSFVVCSL